MLKKLASETLFYGVGGLGARLINYLLVPFYTRWFTPDEYGIVTELYAYASFLLIVLTHGMETAFLRMAGKQRHAEKTYFATALCSVAVVCVGVGASTLAFIAPVAKALEYEGREHLLVLLMMVLILDGLQAMGIAWMRWQGHARRYALVRLASILIAVLLNFYWLWWAPTLHSRGVEPPLWWKSWHVEYVLLANVVSSAVGALLTVPFSVLRHASPQSWKPLISYGLWIAAIGIVGMVNETADRALLKHLIADKTRSLAELGTYGAVYKLAMLITLFTQAFRMTADPFYFSRAAEKSSMTLFAGLFTVFTGVVLTLLVGIYLFLNWLKWFIGAEFHDGLGVVPVLLWANACFALYYNTTVWYKLTDRLGSGALISALGALLTLAVNFLFVPQWGYVACAWATLLSYGTMLIVSVLMSRRYFPVPYRWGRLTLLAMPAVLITISGLWSHMSLWTAVVLLVAYGCYAFLLAKPDLNLLLKDPQHA